MGKHPQYPVVMYDHETGTVSVWRGTPKMLRMDQIHPHHREYIRESMREELGWGNVPDDTMILFDSQVDLEK